MGARGDIDGVLERPITYPDATARDRFARLVGMDSQKTQLVKLLSVLVNPGGLEEWAERHHAEAAGQLIAMMTRRAPLVVLAGDVGSGKTELAETVGDAIARQEKIDVVLLPLSLSARGQGRVGEMTQLLSTAFEMTIEEAKKLKSTSSKKSRGAVILLVDEADALAQSREAAQMHHEDRAGVNAFIRGVDRIGNSALPAAVIMCTNRLGALDPAVKRRAANIMIFSRPDGDQRRAVISAVLSPLDFSLSQVDAIVTATGPQAGRDYGFTYSDLVQRLLPAFALDAYPTHAITPKRALEIARSMAPTPPFREN